MTNICDAVEPCTGAVSRAACENGVFERLRFQTAVGAGGISLWGPPGGVRCQVPLPGSHLVDLSCHELAQADKGAREKGLEVVIAGKGGDQSRPVLNMRLSNPLL